MLVFNNIDTSQLTTAHLDMLSHWVSLGGRLVVGGGPNAAQTMAGLSPILPFAGVDILTLPHPLPALEQFFSVGVPDRGPYVAAIPVEIFGQSGAEHIVLEADNQPLFLSFERDLGQIQYLGFDLGLAPLDTLAGQAVFFPRLGQHFSPENNNLFEQINTGGMRTSLALLPDQTLPSPGTVTLYLVLYVLAIGPINYIVLGRLKRREWAWFSLPIIILLFCGAGYLGGFSLRGGRPLLRQITVIQSQANAPIAELASFVGIYSPRRASYTLEMNDTAIIQNLSGNSSTLNNDLKIVYGNPTVVTDLQADIGGLRAIIARGQTGAPQIMSDLTFDQNTKQVSGAIFNNTGRPITHAHLVFREEGLAIGNLPPGETKVTGRLITRYAYNDFYDTTAPGLSSEETLELASREVAMKTILRIDQYNGADVEGLYLAAWQADSPVEITLADHNSHRREDTLLLVGLPFTSN